MRNLYDLACFLKTLKFAAKGGGRFDVALEVRTTLDRDEADELGVPWPASFDVDRERWPVPKKLDLDGPKKDAALFLFAESDRRPLYEAGVRIKRIVVGRKGDDELAVAFVFLTSAETREALLRTIDAIALDGVGLLLDLEWAQRDLFELGTSGKRNPVFFARGSETDRLLALLVARLVARDLLEPEADKAGPKLSTLLRDGFDVRAAGATSTVLDAGSLDESAELELLAPGRHPVRATLGQIKAALRSYLRRLRGERLVEELDATAAELDRDDDEDLDESGGADDETAEEPAAAPEPPPAATAAAEPPAAAAVEEPPAAAAPEPPPSEEDAAEPPATSSGGANPALSSGDDALDAEVDELFEAAERAARGDDEEVGGDVVPLARRAGGGRRLH